MKIINTNRGTTSLQHPVHGEFAVDADGFFEVPSELAAELLAFPFWTTQDVALIEAHSVDLPALHDPLVAAEALAGLREDLAVLRAGGTLEQPYTGGWEPDFRTLAWVSMHVRGDAPGIADWSRLVVEIDALQEAAVVRAADAARAAAEEAAQAAEKSAETTK